MFKHAQYFLSLGYHSRKMYYKKETNTRWICVDRIPPTVAIKQQYVYKYVSPHTYLRSTKWRVNTCKYCLLENLNSKTVKSASSTFCVRLRWFCVVIRLFLVFPHHNCQYPPTSVRQIVDLFYVHLLHEGWLKNKQCLISMYHCNLSVSTTPGH